MKVSASVETVNIPDIAYRRLDDFPIQYWELVLVSRQTKPSAAVRPLIETVRTSASVAHPRC